MNEKLYPKPTTTNDTENEFVGQNLQRYSLSKLYALRNNGNSQRRPELRAELQTLSFWKFNSGGHGGSYSESAAGGDSEAGGMRPQRQMNLRDRPMSFTRGGGGRIDGIMPASMSMTPKANFMDQRSNSIAHLMPAFAKKRIEAAAAASQQNNGGAGSSCEDIESSRSGTRSDHSNVNSNCTKGLAKFQPSIRNTSPRRSVGRHLGNENDDFLSNLSSPNARHERRIGSGRLLHREVSWEYHDKSSAPMQKHAGNSSRYSDRSNAPPTPSRGYDRRNNSSGDMPNSHNNMRRLNAVGSDEQRPQRRSYNDRNDEPEWFSGGPTSQNDTIELRGFDDPLESNDHNEQGQRRENDHDVGFSENLEDDEREMKKSPSYNSIETPLEDQRQHDEPDAESNDSKLVSKEFNFDAFLNLDPLDPELMRSETSNQHDVLPAGGSRFKRWFANKDKCEETIQSTDSNIGPESQRPPNILLEFIQQTKTPNALEQANLQRFDMPSVEELEARMRKIDVKDSDDCRNAQVVDQDPQKFHPGAQDMAAFKKLLEQLNNVDGNRNAGEVNREQLRSNCMPPLPGAAHMGMVTPTHHLGLFSAPPQPPPQLMSITPVVVPPPPPQPILPNAERMPQMQQQPQIQQPPFPFIGPHPPLPPALILEAENKRREFVNLLHAVNRGQVSLAFLEKELNNPITPPHTKEIISAVLRETSRSMTPSVGQLPPPVQLMRTSPIHHQPDMHSPIPMMNVLAHPQPNRDMIPGGAPPLTAPPPIGMQGPNPQELHIRTQAIFQNAMLKKKMEEQLQQQQQDRRNEVHKPQEEANPSQHYQSSQSQGSTPTGGPNRSLNSPTPLAFTPTSVLRKMTAEKDNNLGSQQHQQLKAPAQLPNKAFQHQQQQLGNSMPPQLPRMILGGGNNAAPPQQNNLVSSPMSPQPVPSLHQQRMPQNDMKWQAMNMVLNQPGPSNVGVYGNIAPPLPLPTALQKPMGRPILKGPPPAIPQMSQQQQQQPQVPSMMFSPTNKIDQQQHQQRLKNNQTPQHMFNQNQPQMPQSFAPPGQGPTHLQPATQAPQAMLHMQHQPSPPQLFQLHQMSLQQQQQMQLQRQLHQQHHPQQRESNQGAGNVVLNNTNVENLNSNNSSGALVNNSRDGGLSPTSNQLAQWFSPELLAQASAGKLPQINVNQALSLEEFERNIQQHSSIVHN